MATRSRAATRRLMLRRLIDQGTVTSQEELVAALARQWHPGKGGLCMHTIVRDGDRVHLGISTGGHYLSEDGGSTFNPSNIKQWPLSVEKGVFPLWSVLRHSFLL